MNIIPLSEGAFTIDKTKRFVPFDLDNDVLNERPIGSLLVEVQPFCVTTSKDVIVLDTGLGFSNNGSLQIHQNLLKNNIHPNEVTKVLLTHLHKDHAGGIAYIDTEANIQPTFPNATYYVRKAEWIEAYEKGFPSYITEDLELLKTHDKVVWIEEPVGIIDQYIHYELTGAHSKFHQVFWIKEEGECLFFGGDDAPQLQQMKTRFVAKYDYDGKKCMELRRTWWEKGKAEQWKFLFYHDIKTPFV